MQFVCELQKLFALLLESNQSYINPKPAINVREGGGGDGGGGGGDGGSGMEIQERK